jgi:hypothetical protein
MCCGSIVSGFMIPKEQSESVYRRRTEKQWQRKKRTKGETTTYKAYA